MPLRGKKPKDVDKRLKMLMFGRAGVGKTTAALQFPNCYVIDTERGAENYSDIINGSGGSLFQTTSFDEIVQEVRSLKTEKHDFQTLVIDPITVIYDDLVASWEKRVGTDFGRGYSAAKKEWKRLTSLLSSLDMNVILTAHAKNLYAEGTAMKIIGQTFDGPKGADYYMDLVIEVVKVTRAGGLPDQRCAHVVKSRIATMPETASGCDSFEFSYDNFADRYGRDLLERKSEPVTLATTEQVEKLKEMLTNRNDAAALGAKWLRAASVEDFADMTSAQIEGCLQWLMK
jgi:GTPase SAR1 family protein